MKNENLIAFIIAFLVTVGICEGIVYFQQQDVPYQKYCNNYCSGISGTNKIVENHVGSMIGNSISLYCECDSCSLQYGLKTCYIIQNTIVEVNQ
jgi:hypothetical protein